MAAFRPELETCPLCGSCGNCRIHDYYGRGFIDLHNHRRTTEDFCIQEQIYYLYKEKHQPLLLAIDEAQYLSTGILNDIKMLMNYGYDSVNCFSLILCGESHLNDTLRKPVHEYMSREIYVNDIRNPLRYLLLYFKK